MIIILNLFEILNLPKCESSHSPWQYGFNEREIHLPSERELCLGNNVYEGWITLSSPSISIERKQEHNVKDKAQNITTNIQLKSCFNLNQRSTDSIVLQILPNHCFRPWDGDATITTRKPSVVAHSTPCSLWQPPTVAEPESEERGWMSGMDGELLRRHNHNNTCWGSFSLQWCRYDECIIKDEWMNTYL